MDEERNGIDSELDPSREAVAPSPPNLDRFEFEEELHTNSVSVPNVVGAPPPSVLIEEVERSEETIESLRNELSRYKQRNLVLETKLKFW